MHSIVSGRSSRMDFDLKRESLRSSLRLPDTRYEASTGIPRAFFAWLPIIYLTAQTIFSLLFSFLFFHKLSSNPDADILGYVAGAFAILTSVIFIISWYLKAATGPNTSSYKNQSINYSRSLTSNPNESSQKAVEANLLALCHMFADLSIFILAVTAIIPAEIIDTTNSSSPVDDMEIQCDKISPGQGAAMAMFFISPTVTLISSLMKTYYLQQQHTSLLDLVSFWDLLISTHLPKLLLQLGFNAALAFPLVLTTLYSHFYNETGSKLLFLLLPCVVGVGGLVVSKVFSLFVNAKLTEVEIEDGGYVFMGTVVTGFILFWPFILIAKASDWELDFCSHELLFYSLGVYAMLTFAVVLLAVAFYWMRNS